MTDIKRIVRIIAALLMLALAFTLVACGKCDHQYLRGVCTKCGNVDPNFTENCSHIYVNGVCTSCGTVCSHSFSDGFCDACGVACNHSFTDGVCDKCSYACTHSFTDGACDVCDFTCTHNFVNGICNTCEMACNHSFTDGVCEKCTYVCTHNFVEGVCSDCATVDPDYVPADAGRSMYSEIVETYKYLILYKYVNEELPPMSDDAPYYTDALYEVAGQFDPAKNFGYSYKDIDGDGYAELLLVEGTSRIYAIFTVRDGAAALVATFQSGMGYLENNGTVFYNSKTFSSSGGQLSLGNHFAKLVGGELVGIAYGWEDGDGNYDTQGDDIYFYISESGEKTVLSKEEYAALRDCYLYYWQSATRITKLSNLSFNPALTAELLTDKTADFSSYDAIIRTFAIMHTEVTGGKCVRSKWTASAYDLGMVFLSDEDFVIYNRLFAACVLVQSNERASFGYARCDLDSDGTEELILLDETYNVLAIFTEADGRPVLLDSYYDRRTAFIDENGLIHVKQRTIPGTEDDSQYFVYELCDGSLAARVEIGVKYDFDGNVSEIYKLSEGVAVGVESDEWNALYAEYEIDLGESSFAVYTKDNSGLTFTAASAE
ncbi:MAG: hypothetical protein IKL79_06075 [Clostridia bacterium]|nr:hypothetical protein [Clostridia bacterium]